MNNIFFNQWKRMCPAPIEVSCEIKQGSGTPLLGLTIHDFDIPQLFDASGYHCDTESKLKSDDKGYYTIIIKDLGRSDKTIILN